MRSVLDTAWPYFAQIFCGYGAVRFRLLNEAGVAGINTFVFHFALPAFLLDPIMTCNSDYRGQ
ncbi:MAG: AEC family transporter [Actinomycetota bacterium]|nr:AEC family transporter [Actinomycetota bacterium]